MQVTDEELRNYENFPKPVMGKYYTQTSILQTNKKNLHETTSYSNK